MNYFILIILIYLILINIITFMVFGVDKRKAKKEKWRVPEATLLLLSVIGGSIGALVGMRLFHHKTKKAKFRIGVPVILILQIILVALIAYLLIINLHASFACITIDKSPDCYVLRTPAILTVFAIRPIGLLAHTV